MKVGAIILAAGQSARFGDGNKLLAEIGGEPMIRRVALAVSASCIDEVVLVVSPSGGAIAKAAGEGRWRVVVAENASAGLSASLGSGLETLPADTSGALIALGDMPDVSTELTNKLVAAFAMCGGQSIVFPQDADGRQGNPVVWPRGLFARLQTLTGDAGGKSVLNAHTQLWHPVLTADAGAFRDVDTRQDLARREAP